MAGLFVPCVITLTAITGLQRINEYLTTKNEPSPRRDFIPELPGSFDYERLKSFSGNVVSVKAVFDQELIQWSLGHAEKIPEFKVCFPEIQRAIIDYCSNNPGFISQFQYTIVALRAYNCLRLRSLGVEEIDFDTVEKDYKNYLLKMPTTEWNFYHEAYNLVRGLCANERQYKSMQDVKDTVRYINYELDHHVNCTKKLRVRMYPLAKNTISRCQKKFDAEKKTTKRVSKLLQKAKQHYTINLQEQTTTMNKAVQQSSFYTNTLENTVNTFSRNLRRIGQELNSDNSLHSLLDKYTQNYDIETNEIEKKIAMLGFKLGQLYEINQKYNHKPKVNKARKQTRLNLSSQMCRACVLCVITFCIVFVISYLESIFLKGMLCLHRYCSLKKRTR